MKIYFAGEFNNSDIYMRMENRLASYFYIKNMKADNIFFKFKNRFLDSGAFSAFTRGVKIDIDEYCKFTKKFSFTVISVLDDIEDPSKTLENQNYMESQDVFPNPCYHIGEPLEYLHYYCKKYDYISVGGMVPHTRNKPYLKSQLDLVWDVIYQYFPLKVHGFGLTTLEMLSRYPWYSVDSTSWLSGGIRQEIYSMDYKKIKFKSVNIKNKDIFNILGEDLNFDLFPQEDNSRYTQRNLYNVVKFKQMEKFLTDTWEKRGVKW